MQETESSDEYICSISMRRSDHLKALLPGYACETASSPYGLPGILQGGC